MENDQSRVNRRSLYQRIYGGTQTSLNGPLFFLIVGILSIIIALPIIWLEGGFYHGLLTSDGSLRPDVNFPLFNILIFFLIMSTVVGTLLGTFGIIWCQLCKDSPVQVENE
ncbi:MAG: hypothetical protein ACFE9L_18850 [Candidatus Hodarchaeota archaeon]